ncbi:MAG TPA: NAD(P)-binding domain-containing protein [Terracidiphilus sp.]
MHSAVIVGSGPYGLSVAAHLAPFNVEHRIFGRCMETWDKHMPPNMLLKSEGFASDLYAGGAGYPLRQFCGERNIPYEDIGIPVQRRTFVEYGREFQRRLVPRLEQTMIKRLSQVPGGFELQTAEGQTLQARRVVLAVGITDFAYLPPSLRGLPKRAVSHSYDHGELSEFQGKRVLVVGAGASAVDLAIDLKKAGALPELMARASRLLFHFRSIEPRPLRERLRRPRSTIGIGWRSKLFVDLPLVFHAMPEGFRHRTVARHLGPSSGWFAQAEFEGHIPTYLGCQLAQVSDTGSQIRVFYTDSTGLSHEIETDHIIAATGYRPVVGAFSFLHEALAAKIESAGETPKLDRNFMTTVPGLYMVGLASANDFGPLCRFACGAEFTSRRLARHLARS